jgi:signal transduction histidine kinase
MEIDPRTLFLVHSVTSLTLGGMVFAFWRAHRSMPCLALWAGGATLIGVGSLFIALRGAVPDTVSIVIANTLSLAGGIVIWNGIRVFNARGPRWVVAAVALPLMAFAVAYWTYVDEALWRRISLVNGALAVTGFVCAYELFHFGRRPLPRIALVAGAPLVFNGIVLTARALFAFTLAPTPGLMTAGGPISLLIPLVGNIVTSFGFLVMTAERYIEQRSELEARLFRSQKMEGLGTLAGGIAHDLNNMLVPIMALSKMMALRFPEGSRERGNLSTVLRASERARDLVRQILAFSRGEPPMLQTVDLAQVARDSLKLLRASVPSTIKIVERIAAVSPLLGDIGKLHQVITNLVINAAQAIGDRHGTIIVEVTPAPAQRSPRERRRALGSALRLTVRDTGCGMDQATAARMFDPFFTTKPAGVGTGLGLSVVHGIIEQHGGRIAVESTVGAGTRLDIYLPADAANPDLATRHAVTAA